MAKTALQTSHCKARVAKIALRRLHCKDCIAKIPSQILHCKHCIAKIAQNIVWGPCASIISILYKSKENQQKKGWVGFEVLEAEIPGCEIFNLIIEVKSLTEGLGSFEHEFERMQTVQNKQLSESLIKEFTSKEKQE